MASQIDQALEADHNDVVASMNSIILSGSLLALIGIGYRINTPGKPSFSFFQSSSSGSTAASQLCQERRRGSAADGRENGKGGTSTSAGGHIGGGDCGGWFKRPLLCDAL
eukprot:symbB.v1.2.019045.t1/scaffold1537.1/size118942/10